MKSSCLARCALAILLPGAQLAAQAPAAKRPAGSARETRAAPARRAPPKPEVVVPALKVDPGMTREQVVSVLGQPMGLRTVGARTYLFYRNGRERAAGMSDVVFLDNDAVVDAIFRAPSRRYTGTSSSAGQVRPEPTNVTPASVDRATAAPAVAAPGRAGTTVLPSIVGGAHAAQSVPLDAVSRPADAVSRPVAPSPSDTAATRPQPKVPWERPKNAGPPIVRQP